MELQSIKSLIFEIRGQKEMLDFHLATLYDVHTKRLNLAVKRNLLRFPTDFMFQLTKEEWDDLRFQFETPKGRGGHRYLPHAFTEQGVAMLSSVLRSEKAVSVNINIIRTFVFIREYALSHKDLTAKLREMETKYDRQFRDIYEAIKFLVDKDKMITSQRKRRPIGFERNKT